MSVYKHAWKVNFIVKGLNLVRSKTTDTEVKKQHNTVQPMFSSTVL